MELGYITANVPLNVRIGNTVTFAGVYTQMREDGLQYPVDLRNCQIRGTARTQYNAELDKFDMLISIDRDQDKNPGQYIIVFHPTMTKQYQADTRPKKFIYDIEVEDAEGNIYTFQEGYITMYQESTL